MEMFQYDFLFILFILQQKYSGQNVIFINKLLLYVTC